MAENQLVPAAPKERLKDILNLPDMQQQLQNALKGRKDIFIASIIDLYSGDKNLQACNPKDVALQALKCAVLDLPVNKSLGYSWIIPYAKSYKDAAGNWQKMLVPQAQIGAKGYVQLAIRSNQYEIINVDTVFEGELQNFDKLSGMFDLNGKKIDGAKPIGFFAYFKLKGGFSKMLYSTVDEIREHAVKYSKSYPKNPADPKEKDNIWVKNFNEMAEKTVLSHLLSKWGLLSIEMQEALEIDRDVELNFTKQTEIDDMANTENVGFEEQSEEEEQEQSQLNEATEKETVPLTVVKTPATPQRGKATQQNQKPEEGNLFQGMPATPNFD